MLSSAPITPAIQWFTALIVTGNEIKYGAKLTVREMQVAIFVNEGQVADVLYPGMYVLETKTLPLLSTLQHWDHGFQSPFKAEVYFFNMRQFTNLQMGHT